MMETDPKLQTNQPRIKMNPQDTATKTSNNFNPPLDLYWLHPVHFTHVEGLTEDNETIHRNLRLPLKSEVFDSDQQRFVSQWVVMVLNFIMEHELLKHRWRPPILASNGRLGFTEYGIIPKPRFNQLGRSITAFKSIEDVNDNQEILTDEYKAAPIEAKIFIKPNFVSCRYAITSEQEDGREILRIAANVHIPEKSVCVDFIHRNFTLVSDEKVMAVIP